MQNNQINFNSLADLLSRASFGGELLIFIGMVCYSVFAFILMSRVKIMNQNFNTPHAGLFTMFARLNFLASLVIALIALMAIA